VSPASPGPAKHPYASEAYAAAFREFAAPIWLPQLRTHVLERPIPPSARHDAMGCYPLCVLEETADAAADFTLLRSRGLVSLVLVADALGGPGERFLRSVFDRVRPFKTHYVHDYSLGFAYDRHHRYEVKRARAGCQVEAVKFLDSLEDWLRMYAILIERNAVTGLQRFSHAYFKQLAALPGLHAFAARHEGRVVAMHLFVEHAGIAYSHLACSDDTGYRLRCGYALNDFAIEYFRGGRLLDFGGGAGVGDDPRDGLATFKRGFANRSEPFFLCGKVLDADAYASLSAGRTETDYFPAYRSPTR
jgi:hypothetical protein